MHTATAEPTTGTPSAAIRVTVVMSPSLRDRIQQLADSERRSVSNQCAVLIERALADTVASA